MAIPGIFGRKKVFLKNGTRPYFGHYQCASLWKKSEKTNDEISRKCQKTGFSGIFPAFSAGNEFFSGNWSPSHFGYYHFAPLCQKSEKTNEPISRKAGNRRTDERTNERTNKRTTVNL